MAEKKYELKEIQKLQGHTGKVWSVAWNVAWNRWHTGTETAFLASCGADKTVRIWMRNPQTAVFECLKTIKGFRSGTGRSCYWSPNGDALAIANCDGTTSIWDMIENDFEYKCILKLKGHKNEVKSVSWSASGGHLATCSSDSVLLWGLSESGEEYECVEEFEEHTQDVEVVQWHPFKDMFACGCDKTINIWERYSDHDEWNFVQTLDQKNNGHLSKVCSISFNATGDRMVTSSADLSIRVWGEEGMESADGYVHWEHLYTLPGFHKRTIFSVHWSSEGIIASGAADGAICLFVENQDGLSPERRGAMYKLLLKKEKAHETDVNSVQWGPKSQERSEAMYEMQLTKKKAHETDVNSAQQGPKERSKDMEKARETEVTAVQWGPKEIGLLASSSDDGTVNIWELTSHQ